MTLPTGTVTFLFTDIEGSTKLWEKHPETMRSALARHDTLAASVIEQHGGVLVKSRGEGDSLFAVFPHATESVAAACALQQVFVTEPWPQETPLRVRMALHTGEADLRAGDYYGSAVNRCARLRAIGHGGQVLLSEATHELVGSCLPEGASLREMGRHRLKDLQQPELVYQLCHSDLPSDFPPLRSLSPTSTNLPIQATSFIGREREIAQIKRLLARTHLLTLTGSGGCGKTRLALQVAADLVEEYEEGVWLVELASLSDPGLVVQTVADALGVREEPNRPLVETLTNYLKPKFLLLALDNCEHLLSSCAQLAERLLQACPHLRILTTSREALHVQGEQPWRVPSLSVPDVSHLPRGAKNVAAALSEYEAVRLFVDRARVHRPDFSLTRQNGSAVAAVCQHLDGIPLALELAAARVRALSVEQMEARLSDRFRLLTGGSRTAPTRQQTLLATLDWSYALLTGQERTLLLRLSVFAGGATLEACEQVCSGGEVAEWAVLDVLTSLVDKSLVVYEEREGIARYRLLETIREYARQKLRETEEGESLQSRHRDYFLALAEEAKEKLKGPEQAEWLERLETEHDNLRAALDCCQGQDQGAEAGLRLAGALQQFWWMHGHLSEGRGRLSQALERAAGSGPSKARADALNGMGALAYMQGDNTAARSFYEQSLALRRELDDKSGIAASLNNLGLVACNQGDNAGARAFYEESLAICRGLGNKLGIAAALSNLGLVVHAQSDYAGARALQEESLALRRELGDKGGMALSLTWLSAVAHDQGDYPGVQRFLTECLILCRELGEKRITAYALEGFARLAYAQHQPERAVRLYGAAQALREAIGSPMPPNVGAKYERIQADLRAALGEDGYQAGLDAGRALSTDQAIAYALEETAAGGQDTTKGRPGG